MFLVSPSSVCLFIIFQVGQVFGQDTTTTAATGTALVPLACQEGYKLASMGSSYSWPQQNPGLVAPKAVVWDYPAYSEPLACSYTGKSLAVEIPASVGEKNHFHLGTSSTAEATDEKYILARLEIRKPAQAYAGVGQQLSHVMEMVMIHKQDDPTSADKKRWANIILPFQVSTSGAAVDIIGMMINGVNLPGRIGESGIILSSASGKMDFAPGFKDATFSEFWGTAPDAGCETSTENVRYFMRNDVLTIGLDTFDQLAIALQSVPAQEPSLSPKITWIVGTCAHDADCVLPTPKNLEAQVDALKIALAEAQQLQSTSLKALEPKLAELAAHTGAADQESIALFNEALTLYNQLKNAAAMLESSKTQLAQAEAWLKEQVDEKFDSDAPALVQVSTKASVSFVDAGKKQEQRDCSALGQSPVDIQSKRVVDPAALSAGLTQPLGFRYTSLSELGQQGTRVRMFNRGSYIRVAVPPGSVEWPLGGVLSNGVLRGVSYIDIHVPGQHSVDGRLPAAELQLVHESAGGKPAMALAVPLDVSVNEPATGTNDWLEPLLVALPKTDSAKDMLGAPLGSLHNAIRSGLTSAYYRYDGSLTKPPCLRADWYILEEPGHISHKQLSALGEALNIDMNSKPRGLAFMTNLVMRGSPQLIDPRAGISPVTLASGRNRGKRHFAV
jgi:carbonic anhydrase